jgi:hypothetical protein
MTTPQQLETAIRDAGDGAPASLAALATALFDASLVVPISEDGPEGTRLVTLLHDGAPYVPAYTRDDLADAAVPPELSRSTVPVRVLVDAWDAGTALALNPGLEPAGWLDGAGVLALRRSGTVQVPEATDVRVGAPAVEPTALLAAASAFLAGDLRVRRAHHAQVWFDADGEVPHLTVAVVTTEPADDLAADLAAALPVQDGPVDILVVPEGTPTDAFTQRVLAVAPFHTA